MSAQAQPSASSDPDASVHSRIVEYTAGSTPSPSQLVANVEADSLVSARSAAAESEQPQIPSDRQPREIILTDQTNLLPPKVVIPVFFGLSLCALISCLDSTIVATALPTISNSFHAGAVISWVPSAYLLSSTAFQPIYGRLTDIFGRKAGLGLAMALYMLGNLCAGFSRSIIELIIFRGIAGAGGGAIVGISQIVVSDLVSLRERGKYQGYIGGIMAAGYAVGPPLGGVLAEKVSWRWSFWITLPLSLVAMFVVLLVLPLKRVEGAFRRKLLAIDYLGAVLTLAGCTLIILPLIWGGVTFPWSSAVVLAPLSSGALVVFLFCIWEWKGARLPIVPMYIFKRVTVVGVYITMFVNGMIFNSSLYYLPQFFQVALGYSPIRSGIFLLPVLVSQVAASTISGQIVSKTGRYRIIIHSGFTIIAIGCGCLSTVTVNTNKALLVFFMLLVGIGGGQTLQTTTVAAQASVARRDMSVVTAVRNFIRLLGGTLALAVSATIINNSLRTSMVSLGLPPSTIEAIVNDPSLLADRLGPTGSQTPNPLAALGITSALAARILGGYTHGFRVVFITNAALAAVAMLASVFMIRHQELERGDEQHLREKAKAKARAARRSAPENVEMSVVMADPNAQGRPAGEIERPRDAVV